MKKLPIILSILFFACNGDDDNRNNCNFLFDAGVNLTVNINLPQFSQLAFPGNSVYVSNQGNNGIWLYRLNSATLYAWDAADPSHTPSGCSTLTDSGTGDIVVCGCEDANQYGLATGQGLDGNTQPCTLQPYRVDDLGNNSYLVTN
ncbi:hypothetical protein [Winogradskyella flava]|uniref:Ferredoxin subunit of nitrite reductase or a ring-hydroxylating dioxygenase n=1 Tax=Winogradskyella flava TaxID=1884876 RepID=A0A842IMT6_9FLAO|nr:hypothetical protein [Winogradskyella flava]MBC2844290.1 hypothetical protein [Winogradskyella flava]